MAKQTERDFPLGHPKSVDYDPKSPEAMEWARLNVHPLGERDWPVDHPKAIDTPGNLNHVAVLPGVDPNNPDHEPFTGRPRDEAAASAQAAIEAAARAVEFQPLPPVEADVMNKALDIKRKQVGRDLLTEDEFKEVLIQVQKRNGN